MLTISNWCKSKSMKTQIIMLNLFLPIKVLSIILIAQYLHLLLLMPSLTTLQQNLFTTNGRLELELTLQSKRNLMITFLDQKSNQLMSLHQLTLLGLRMNFTGNQNEFQYDNQRLKDIPASLLDTTPVFNASMTNSFMCAQNTTKFDQSKEKRSQLIEFSNLMGVVGQMYNTQIFGKDQFNYGAIFIDPQILFSYPCLQRGLKFDQYIPNIRPWYIKAEQIYNGLKKNDQIVQFTEPYIFATSQSIDVSLAIPQVDLDNQFIGAWSIDFSGSIFAQYIQSSSPTSQILLVTQSGILLVHNFENKDRIMPLYIYNETVTGYSKVDWMNIINNSDLNNTCNVAQSIPGYFCTYNNNQQKELHVLSSYIAKYEIYLVIISDQSMNEAIISNENQKIEDFVKNQFIELLNRSVTICISHTMVTIIILSIIIIKPINRVSKLINKYLHPNQGNCIAQYRLLIRVFNSETIQSLLTAFQSLLQRVTQSQLKKSKLCQVIEKFKYSRKQKNIRLKLQQTYKECLAGNCNQEFYFHQSVMANLFMAHNSHNNLS